jgi:hypothetical protein
MHSVVVHLQRRDLLRAQFQLVCRARVFRVLFVALLLYAAWDMFDSDSVSRVIGGLAALAMAALITFAAILIVYAFASARLLLRLRRTRGVLGEHRFELGADGLRELSESGETRLAWGSARKLLRTRSFLFVFVRPASLLLLPRRNFPDREAYADFWNRLQPLVAKKIS